MIFFYFGCSPGSLLTEVFLSEIMWFIDKTVAATNHGKPSKELMPIPIEQTVKSKWYPLDFCSNKFKVGTTSMIINKLK